MTNPNPDVAAVAEPLKLTKAQCRAITSLSSVWQTVPPHVSRQSVAVLPSKLVERGWPHGNRRLNGDPVHYRLTDLGTAVRSYLLSQEAGEGSGG